MKRVLTTSLLIAALTLPVLAAAPTPPTLPPTAKKLTGPEIVKLYDGATITWNNFTQKTEMAGTTTFDFKKGTQTGTWEGGGKKGTFTGKIRVKGDLWCYKIGNNKETCDSVYMDGQDIYEVNAKGVVDSQNKKQ